MDRAHQSPSTGAGSFMARLLQCPNEIIIDILAHLQYRDLLMLRVTNHALHRLVHRLEKPLAQRFLVHQKYEDTLSQLYENPKYDVCELVDVSFRCCLATKVALMMADRIVRKFSFRHQAMDEEDMKAWFERKSSLLAARFEPGLLVLFEFFHRFSHHFLEAEQSFAHLSEDDYTTLRDVFDMDQQRLIEGLSLSTLTDTLQTWHAFDGILAAKGLFCIRFANTGPSSCPRVLIARHGFIPLAILTLGLDYNPTEEKQPIVEREMQRRQARTPPQLRKSLNSCISTLRFSTAPDPDPDKLMPALRRSPVAQMSFVRRQDFFSRACVVVLQRMGVRGPGLSVDQERLKGWISECIRQPGDPIFEFGRWNHPDAIAAP